MSYDGYSGGVAFQHAGVDVRTVYAEDFYLGDRGYQTWREGYESYITRILYLRIY